VTDPEIQVEQEFVQVDLSSFPLTPVSFPPPQSRTYGDMGECCKLLQLFLIEPTAHNGFYVRVRPFPVRF